MSIDDIMCIAVAIIMVTSLAVILVYVVFMYVSDSIKTSRAKALQKETYHSKILSRLYSIDNELYRINAKLNYKEKIKNE